MYTWINRHKRINVCGAEGVARAASWAVYLWSVFRPDLRSVLIGASVRGIGLFSECKDFPGGAYAAEYDGGRYILLRRDRESEWPRDFAHELGHLHTKKFGGFVDVGVGPMLDEEFCEKFGLMWTMEPWHRTQMEEIFAEISWSPSGVKWGLRF